MRIAAETNNGIRSQEEGRFTCGDLVIDYDKRRVFVGGEDVHLTQNEYKILRVNMANIRRKIEVSTAEPRYIFTEMGVGYRMAEEDN